MDNKANNNRSHNSHLKHSHLLSVPDVAKHLTAECNAQHETKSAINARRRDTSRDSAEANQSPKESEKFKKTLMMTLWEQCNVHMDTTDFEAIDAVHNPWLDSELNKQAITFKIDTGADVTVISEADYDEDKDGSLSTCNKQLSVPSWEAIDVWGKITKKFYINHKGHLLYPWPAYSTTEKDSNWSPTTSDISEWDTNRWNHQKIPSTVHWVRKT